MRYQAVLFDLDGTLLDTLEDLATAQTVFSQPRACPCIRWTPFAFLSAMDSTPWWSGCCPRICARPRWYGTLRRSFEEEYGKNWHECSAPYPGIAGLLDELTARGLRLSILSNKPDTFTRLCVRQLLPLGPLIRCSGSVPVCRKNRIPAQPLRSPACLACSLRKFCMSATAGWICKPRFLPAWLRSVSSGVSGPADELRQAGAHHLIAQPEELLPIIFSS